MRVFIAVELPEELREAVYRATGSLRSANRGVRWVPARNMHLTLKFIGEIDLDRLGPVRDAAQAVAARTKALSFRLGSLGAFPSIGRPRVVWMDVQGDTTALAETASQLDAALARAGFARATRPFRAHLTLGRQRRPTPLLEAASVEVPDAVFTVVRLVIMQSRLSPRGAEYEVVEAFPFEGGGLSGGS